MSERTAGFCILLWFLMLVLFAFSIAAHGQDIIIPTVSNYLTLARGVSWGTAGSCNVGAGCGINNVYVWTPPSPDSSVCVAITNNNPTSNHSVTIGMSQTLDSTIPSFTGFGNAWGSVPIQTIIMPVSILAGNTQVYFFRSNAAAKLALQVIGSTTQAGSPDTASITVVQPSVNSWCGPGANNGTVSLVIGPTASGSPISAANQSPVVIGGEESQQGTGFVHTALTAALDLSTHGLMVGAAGNFTENSTAINPNTSQVNNGAGATQNANSLLGVYAVGKQVDAEFNTGGTFGGIRISKRYGVAQSSSFGWASDDNNASPGPLLTYGIQHDFTNPGAGANLLNITLTTAQIRAITPHKLYVSCSAACDVILNKVSSAGTTCTALTPYKTYDPNVAGGTAAQTTASFGCTGAPTVVQQIFHIFIAAGQTQALDLEGYWVSGNSAVGVGFDMVNGGALTGTLTSSWDWQERGF